MGEETRERERERERVAFSSTPPSVIREMVVGAAVAVSPKKYRRGRPRERSRDLYCMCRRRRKPIMKVGERQLRDFNTSYTTYKLRNAEVDSTF